MANPTDAFTKNKFVDFWFKLVPDDPILQTQYIYTLTWIVFLGLLGYSIATWYYVFTAFTFQHLFSGLFMGAIALLSFFGLKQVRQGYLMTKELAKTQSLTQMAGGDSVEDMLKSFLDDKGGQKENERGQGNKGTSKTKGKARVNKKKTSIAEGNPNSNEGTERDV